MPAPVRHTCPDIDSIKDTIYDIVKEMETISCDDETINDMLNSWRYSLTDIGKGNRCLIEDLRSANSALRDWGNETEDELEDLKTEKYSLEKEIEELKEKIDDLESTISDLEEANLTIK